MQVFIRVPGIGITSVVLESLTSMEALLSQIRNLYGISLPVENFHMYLQGRSLSERGDCKSWPIENGAVLDLLPVLRGGGGDGGATGAESRDCYLSMYLDKKPDKVDPNEARIARWSRCRISAEVLSPPCAVDFLGNIFNKDRLLEHLVAGSMPPELSHIRGLKDIINIHLTENPAWSKQSTDSTSRFFFFFP